MTLVSETNQTSATSALSPGAFTQTSAADGKAWAQHLSSAMGSSANDDTTAIDRTTAFLQALGGTMATASTALDAQTIGQSSAAKNDARQDFLDYMDMDPMERMRAQILGGMGMTEDQLAALPPEERKKIEDKIRQIIEEMVRREAAEKTAESTESEGTANSTTAIATTTSNSDEDKSASAGPTLEQWFPFLRTEDTQQIGGNASSILNPDSRQQAHQDGAQDTEPHQDHSDA
ncbi:MAG: hypothetical protein JXQ84_04125 [Rhodospirillaceae bacterium]|nr:hypothetical protein [Rhodospirillaceae bacterium]